MAKTILILGGGVGGQVVANELRRTLPREHRVTIIERELTHAFAPSFLWVMTGDRRPEQVTRDLRTLVRPGVEVRRGDIRAIDLANRQVRFDSDSVAYDYLVIALGAELAPDAIPGLAAGAHTFYTLDGATRLRVALDEVKTGTVAVVVSALPYKCPGAPHEAAMLLADVFRRRGHQDSVRVQLFTPEPQPMPVAGPALGDAVRQMLEQRGISFHPSHKLTAVNAERRELLFDGKSPVNYDLLVAIPPHRSPAVGRAGEIHWQSLAPREGALRAMVAVAVGRPTQPPEIGAHGRKPNLRCAGEPLTSCYLACEYSSGENEVQTDLVLWRAPVG